MAEGGFDLGPVGYGSDEAVRPAGLEVLEGKDDPLSRAVLGLDDASAETVDAEFNTIGIALAELEHFSTYAGPEEIGRLASEISTLSALASRDEKKRVAREIARKLQALE